MRAAEEKALSKKAAGVFFAAVFSVLREVCYVKNKPDDLFFTQLRFGMGVQMKKEEFYFLSRDNETKIHAVKWIPDTEPVCIMQVVDTAWLNM